MNYDDEKELTELFQQFTLPKQKDPFPNANEQKEVDIMLQSQGLYDELIFLLNKFSFTSSFPLPALSWQHRAGRAERLYRQEQRVLSEEYPLYRTYR